MDNKQDQEHIQSEQKISANEVLRNEAKEEARMIYEAYGWLILAKEISEYTNTSFFEILTKQAIEIAALIVLMTQHSRYNKLQMEINKRSNGQER